MLVIGIESSCDDTSISLVKSPRKILSNIVISQDNEHEKFQGVVPEIAARSHLRNLEKAIQKSLLEANVELSQIDAIAATSGPGLIGGVIVGCLFGKGLALRLNKPFIAINHLEGHALTACLTHAVDFPFLLLLISGGHCQFISVMGLGKYKIIGSTLDDAVGEVFDKVARMLGLPFPGGKYIEKLALDGNSDIYNLPKPIINTRGANMSFSGLKTAVKLLIAKIKEEKGRELIEEEKANIAASFQYTVGQILSAKLAAAIDLYESPFVSNIIAVKKQIVIAGGVASNQFLAKMLSVVADKFDYHFIVPPASLCTDNAAMIAFAGLKRLEAGLVNDINFCPRARWSLEDL